MDEHAGSHGGQQWTCAPVDNPGFSTDPLFFAMFYAVFPCHATNLASSPGTAIHYILIPGSISLSSDLGDLLQMARLQSKASQHPRQTV